MFITAETLDHDKNVHPSLVANVSIESMVKMLNFGLWVDYQIRKNSSISLKELIMNELKFYETEVTLKKTIQEKLIISSSKNIATSFY
jgi:hypothetical protein